MLVGSTRFPHYNQVVNLDDTIVAIATPPGRGGVGVVRLSGSKAIEIATPMLRLDHRLEPGRAFFRELVGPCGADTPVRLPGSETNPGNRGDGCLAVSVGSGYRRTGVSALHEQRIDEVVVTFFAKPHSYTTDDIIEISAHGRRLFCDTSLTFRRCWRPAGGAGRIHDAGFLNGRIDLTQAEAVRDLIDSQTLFQAKVAAQQLEGSLSHRLKPIKQKLVELIAMLEAGIDFAEDDVSVMPDATIWTHCRRARSARTAERKLCLWQDRA